MHWGLAEHVTTLSEAHDVPSKRMPNPNPNPKSKSKSKSKGEAIMSGKR